MIDRGVSDVAPICSLPMEDLFFDPFSVTNGMNKLRQSRTLKAINRRPPEEFWKWYDVTLPKWEKQAEHQIDSRARK